MILGRRDNDELSKEPAEPLKKAGPMEDAADDGMKVDVDRVTDTFPVVVEFVKIELVAVSVAAGVETDVALIVPLPPLRLVIMLAGMVNADAVLAACRASKDPLMGGRDVGDTWVVPLVT